MKFPLLTTCILLFYFTTTAQTNLSAVDVYNNRFSDARTIEKLQKLQENNTSKNDVLLIHSLKALTYITNKEYNLAKKELDEAHNFLAYSNATTETAFFYYAQGRLYDIYEDADNALKSFLKSYTIFKKDKINDVASEVAVFIYNSSGAESNPKYLNEALDLATNSGNLSAIINARNAYANYIKYIELPKKSDPFTVTFFINYLQESIQLIKDENLAKNKFYLSSLYFNYGYNLLLYDENNKGNDYLDKALALAKKHQFKTIIRNYYGAKGSILLEKGKLEEAKTFYLNGLQEIKTIPFTDNATELLFYKDLKVIAEKQQKWQEYFSYDKVYQELNTKLNDENKQKAIQTALAKYEWQEKEEKIQLLSSKNKFQWYLIGSLVFVLLLLLVVGYLFQKNQKLRLNLLSEKTQLLELEKTNSQKELLNSVLHLEKKNELLNDIKAKLLEQNKETPKSIHQHIFKTIDEGILIDDDFNRFKDNFNPIYPNFFNQLQEKANHHLTQLDLKYCAFILMKLSNKEIASQMNVEPKSIRMARYRIKQKLNLNKEEDLDTYIESLSKT